MLKIAGVGTLQPEHPRVPVWNEGWQESQSSPVWPQKPLLSIAHTYKKPAHSFPRSQEAKCSPFYTQSFIGGKVSHRHKQLFLWKKQATIKNDQTVAVEYCHYCSRGSSLITWFGLFSTKGA